MRMRRSLVAWIGSFYVMFAWGGSVSWAEPPCRIELDKQDLSLATSSAKSCAIQFAEQASAFTKICEARTISNENDPLVSRLVYVVKQEYSQCVQAEKLSSYTLQLAVDSFGLWTAATAGTGTVFKAAFNIAKAQRYISWTIAAAALGAQLRSKMKARPSSDEVENILSLEEVLSVSPPDSPAAVGQAKFSSQIEVREADFMKMQNRFAAIFEKRESQISARLRWYTLGSDQVALVATMASGAKARWELYDDERAYLLSALTLCRETE